MPELNDLRLLLAAERTLLAWNRTSLALIGFGFLVERSGLLTEGNGADDLTFVVGLGFIALGILAVFFSSRQYMLIVRSLNAEEFPASYSARFGLVVNALVGVLGAALVIALYFGQH
ncbi:MAG: DUF202 domain-containing protein [Pseudomonadota bacterium]